jgi:hypothetical protein
MRVFPDWVEHALDVTVQRPHDADPGEHRRPIMFRNQQEPSIAACHSSASCSALGNAVM